MLQVFDLEKSYGDNSIFSEVNFAIAEGERVGIVGRNGHGKTTLFRLIIGEESSENGKIVFPKNYSVGYLSQNLKFSENNVVDEGVLGLPVSERDARYKVEKVLLGLGFSKIDFQKKPQELSGGFQVRLNLTKVLVSNAQMLLLDEPTNYLDILSLRWLAKFLRNWPHELMLITHDREFMDSVVTHILGIHRKRIRKTKGTTSDYFQKIALDEEIYEKTRLNEEKRVKEIQNFVDKFRAKARQGSLVQSRVKMLSKLELKEKLDHVSDLDFSFTYSPFNSKWPLTVKNISFSYNDSTVGPSVDPSVDPTTPLLINNLSFSLRNDDRLAIIGKNGKGKTTLLNLLAQKLKSKSGSIDYAPNVKVAFFEQTNRDTLHAENSIEDEIKSTNPELAYSRIRGICGTMMFSGDDSKKKIRVLSGGEKSRVLLGKILATQTNLLLLDEPTNHLDLESTTALIESLNEFEGAAIVVTHNEMLLKTIPNRFIIFQKEKIELFEGTYEEFLNKGGFDEEDKETELVTATATTITTTATTTITLKEYKLLKRDIINDRSKIIIPLKNRIDDLEKKIITLEKEKEELSNKFINVSGQTQNDDSKTISQTAKRLGEIEKELPNLYQQFDEIVTNHSEEETKFESLLSALEERLKKN
ncbi:MAG: ATP-binding cassette domain-containing protein [Oligoflexia bacterium]|nr:ATP-binding cassette domain-containing protein [Oligoflexia bacterium]